MMLATVTTIPTWFLVSSLGLLASIGSGLIAVIGFFLRRLIGQVDDQGERLGRVERVIARLVPGEIEP